MKNKRLERWEAMRAWDKTFKMGHLPKWFTKLNGGRSIWGERSDLWDHYGSVKRGNERAVITQPYGDSSCVKIAEKWATDHGCLLVDSHKGGPWHEETWYFEFMPMPKS